MTLLSSLLAQSETATSAGAREKVWEFLMDGGVFMAFIVACSFVAVAITLHRMMSLRWKAILPPRIVTALQRSERYFSEGDYSGVQSLITHSQSPLARVSRVAISPEHGSREAAATAVETAAREEVGKLQAGLAALDVIITIAPLLGLLGTVSGLVTVFASYGDASAGAEDTAVIASGIATALNTTIAGLAVAVPTVIVHRYLDKRIETLAIKMEILVGKLLNAFYRHGGEPMPAGAELKDSSEEQEEEVYS